ncbi:class I SAM-dependent DNA methyltransferase [Paenibacillus silvae]|uniref:class I SAM-dependent DNA methyltransferase n=1 Tax=Paenibacillus silvae TaxID=1325358 RepID=UPI0011A812DB|nr:MULTISPECIES: class I SAM-dependent methyltransferase [Paenibacillus]MCK6078836.1 class I SAM-dependent methyltransferase [Paenibacillus silvae]MCK6153155.1 class I SAM-dependent methyltransferase [Paenibacillus silvae]MCK6271666.1 class I SAM-dependent methyltransferase [Paenibacillus silvae]
MSEKGSDFYDNDAVFQTYMEHRQGRDNANDTLEKPVMLELIGDASGKSILDLGCGDARFAAELLGERHKGSAYTGVEGSINMVTAAHESVKGLHARIEHSYLEEWTYPADTYDLAISRLAIHYIEDVNSLFRSVYATLRKQGLFVFSVEHPVITSTLQPSGMRTNWVVDQYFVEGYREQQWLGGSVKKMHRSIESYYTALQQAGFRVEQLRESAPQRAYFADEETYERRKRIPLFLFLAARKPD